MMRALCMALFVGSAMAQNAADKKPEEKKQEKQAERPRLNLRLDNPSSFATVKPEEKGQKGLPALGGDAQKLPPAGMTTQNPTFPKDTNPNY